ALLRVPGVGDIETVGEEFSMRIWLKPDKLSQLGIGASEVTAALREQNVQVAAGAVGASPQRAGQVFEYPIMVNGKINSTAEFERIIIRTRPEDGSVVYLRDVARLELGRYNYDRQTYLVNNQSCVFLLYQTPGSNAISTADGIYKELASLSGSFPADFTYYTGFDSVKVVEVSIAEVVETMGEALLLVILVVFLFLQSWRATLIPVLAIPVSLVGTFIFFVPLGFTINTLTLFGFVLAIGIVVDDAIVVVEAVQHYIDAEGLSPKEATRKAMRDITGPVVAIALILAAVFVPVGFIPGIVGRLYQQFAITIAISVMLSAFVALTLTPALCALLLRPGRPDAQSKGLNRLFYRFNGWFARVTRSYSHGVRKAIRATPLVLVLLACVYAGTFALFRAKPTGFIPTEDEGQIYISFELPEAASSVRTREVVREIGSILERQPGIDKFTSIAGLNFITFANKSNSGTYFLQLEHWDKRKDPSLHLDAIIAQLQQKLAAVKEANIVVVSPPAIPGLGQTGGFSFVLQQRQSTDDIKRFETVMNTFLTELRKRPEIGLAFSFFTARTPGYRLDVDREKAKKLGVSLADVFATMSTYMGSQYVNDFTLYGRTFRVVAQADTVYRKDIRELGQYYVLNQRREPVPLSALASYRVEESAPVLAHYNLFRATEINGNPAPGYSSGQAIQALREVAAQVLPTGYGYEFSGLSREELAAGYTTTLIFGLSILLVFLLLAGLYESWSVPFSVLLAVPLGAFGAIVTLTLLPQLSNNVYAQIGLV
ncbi:MAG TPA: efflux RND transporter permease subunit, partial [Cytophagales bacterium]